MKTSLAVAVGTVFLLAAGMPLAQDAKAPASKPNVTAPQAGPTMNMGSQMGQMDEHMKKMQTLHEKMASAPTPEERQKLMARAASGNASRHGDDESDAPGGGMMGGHGRRDDGAEGQARRRRSAQMQMMQKRMDMMQMMMQSMMDQQG